METTECISAKELKARQAAVINKKCNEQLRKIGTLLEKAANTDLDNIKVDEVFYPEVVTKLEELGYNVDMVKSIISW